VSSATNLEESYIEAAPYTLASNLPFTKTSNSSLWRLGAPASSAKCDFPNNKGKVRWSYNCCSGCCRQPEAEPLAPLSHWENAAVAWRITEAKIRRWRSKELPNAGSGYRPTQRLLPLTIKKAAGVGRGSVNKAFSVPDSAFTCSCVITTWGRCFGIRGIFALSNSRELSVMQINPKSESNNGPGQNPIFLSVAAVAAFVLLLAGMIYIGKQLDTLEDGLRFRPPEVPAQTYGNAFVLDVVQGQTLYVPVYSHIYSQGGEAYPLEVTLSIRNTDPEHGIHLTTVSYFDTKGKLVKKYLDRPLALAPLETVAFLIEKQDARGGSGANFMVSWGAEEPVYEPVVEAVMIGVSKDYSISFMSPARPLAGRAERSNIRHPGGPDAGITD